jgi:hypothetical protein
VTDLAAARRFVQLHGRLLDRRRLAHLLDEAPPALVETAVAAYANPDGGYAGLLEPDVRTLASQPIAALTALDVLHETAAAPPGAVFDWLTSISNGDGGIPFHLPAHDAAPQAPWMQPSPHSSLHMTAAVAAAALRVGAAGPWVEAASQYCRATLGTAPRLTAYETKYALDFLDATADTARLQALGQALPRDGRLAVEGGTEGETLSLLVLSPFPAGPPTACSTNGPSTASSTSSRTRNAPTAAGTSTGRPGPPRWPSSGEPGSPSTPSPPCSGTSASHCPADPTATTPRTRVASGVSTRRVRGQPKLSSQAPKPESGGRAS